MPNGAVPGLYRERVVMPYSAQYAGGVLGDLVSPGMDLEMHGDRGALRLDFRRMGELEVRLDHDHQNAAFQTRFVAPGDDELGRFQPGSGMAMSYDDLKVIEAHRLVQSIVGEQSVGGTIDDALAAARLSRPWRSRPGPGAGSRSEGQIDPVG